ncbi:MAG TPA: bifunctional protein-serine/threonine kinase/phosphatase [Moraxellaceae bacterium]|nr:bifunctional protein-serine/threonine kinase/phosphatase [Moraxellaceae bacterium]
MTMALSTSPNESPTRLRVRAAQASRAGHKAENEDAIGIRVPDAPLLARKGLSLAIADGVSGAGEGRHAAEACVQGFLSDFYSTPDTWSVRTAGERVLNALNRWLHGQGQQYTQIHQGFLTTFSALVLRARSVHLFHVGDSRIWRLRQRTLEPLTLDHATRVGAGKTYLTRAVGMAHEVEIDYRISDAAAGDVFLLTTDGVHEFLTPARLKKLLDSAADDPQACCERLLDAALEAGSDDNVSCQLLVVDSLDVPEAGDTRRQVESLPLLPDLSPGQRLDGLIIEEEVHANARSQVYRVRDERTGRLLVLKTPSRLCEGDAAALARFAVEDWLGQRFDHRHLIRGIAPPETRSSLYLLQEALQGETLTSWRKRYPFPAVQDVIALAEQAIKGLQALHRREVLHQDLKPDNLFLCTDGTLKLIDLGSARVAGLEEVADTDCPGAAEYASPESLLHLPRDERADQFSLAVTLYELLTGEHPFGDEWTRARTLFDFRRMRYQSACRQHPHVPLWMDAALCKALSLDPDNRYETLSEFLADLKRPNPALAPVGSRPWLERDPTGFWRALSLALAGIALLELLLLLAPWRH